MKQAMLLTIFVVLFTPSVMQGQLNLQEDFSYTAATNLTANGWTVISGGGTTAITVANSGLFYTGYFGSGVGNAASMNTCRASDDAR